MGRAMRASLGPLLLVLTLAGCGEVSATAASTTVQHECERAGGVWRGAQCDASSGGGGY